MDNFQELNLNEENQNWLNLLCENEENKKMFKEQFYSKQSPMLGILAFRSHLLEKRKEQNLTEIEIDKATKSKNKPKLLELISNLFLEPVSVKDINNYIDSSDISVDELIQLHSNHNKIRFSTILNSWKPMLDIDNSKRLPKAI